MIFRRRALLCLVGISLMAPTVAFRTPTTISNTNSNSRTRNSLSTTHSSRCIIHQINTAPSSPSSRTAAADRHATASSCRGRVVTAMAEGDGGGGDGGGVSKAEYYTPADLDAYSEPWGITLHYRGTLNSYRIEAHRPNGEVAGYTTGFYLGDLLHLDKVQIQRKASEYEPGAPNAPAPGTRDLPWAAKTGNLFQLGAVLGCAAVRYGWDRGARKVELLAIRENDKQHSRLVRYYRIAGFRAEREVGEDLGSLKDRLLWGAEGTLMTANAEEFMRRWTSLMLDTTSGSLASAEMGAEAGKNARG